MSPHFDPKDEARMTGHPVPTTHLIEPVETQFLICVCHGGGYSLWFDLLIFREYSKASAMIVTHVTASSVGSLFQPPARGPRFPDDFNALAFVVLEAVVVLACFDPRACFR